MKKEMSQKERATKLLCESCFFTSLFNMEVFSFIEHIEQKKVYYILTIYDKYQFQSRHI